MARMNVNRERAKLHIATYDVSLSDLLDGETIQGVITNLEFMLGERHDLIKAGNEFRFGITQDYDSYPDIFIYEYRLENDAEYDKRIAREEAAVVKNRERKRIDDEKKQKKATEELKARRALWEKLNAEFGDK